ncbi:MAG TPA: glutathione S-transferase family protein [Thermosynechococcaceae cyanobacterium]
MVQLTSSVESPVRLITIPVSHYCEKTRWALTRLKIPFVEEPHMPPFHRFATQKVGGQSVPVLVTATSVLTNSEEILEYADAIAPDEAKLYPADPENRRQVEKLVRAFDSVLAPAVRQWFYFHTFDQPQLIQPLWCQGVPWFERVFFPLAFKLLGPKLLQAYSINAESAITAHKSICKILERVDSLLADGRTHLVGNQFSAADLTFATLGAPVVLPAGYSVKPPELSELPSQMVADIQVFRETLAGKFILRLYQEHEQTIRSLSV